jgi:5-methylcytosine-specific restriction protein A
MSHEHVQPIHSRSGRSPEALRGFASEKQLIPLLTGIAHSIAVADEADSAKWGVRVNQKDLMLKVGFVEVLQAGDGWLHLLLRKDLVPRQAKADRRLRFSKDMPYKNAPGCISCDVELPFAVQAYKSLQTAHEGAVRIAAQSRRHTTTIKDHSPDFVKFLSEELGYRLPQPSYNRDSQQLSLRSGGRALVKKTYLEGAVNQVLLNKYERDPSARRACIQHYGPVCAACDAILENLYGPAVSGLIHVHHIVPLSISKSRKIDPVRDLRPICPNCHAVIHSINPARTIDQVRRMIRDRITEEN